MWFANYTTEVKAGISNYKRKYFNQNLNIAAIVSSSLNLRRDKSKSLDHCRCLDPEKIPNFMQTIRNKP
jgi:hypothetical protein